MGLKIKIISSVLGFIFFVLILKLVKKNNVKPSYAFLWISLSLFLLSIPLLEPLYKWISTTLIGIEDARHIIYITLIGFLLIYNFYITIKISQMSDQIQTLISYTSVLEKELKDKNEQQN